MMKIGDIVRILKLKNIFEKGYISNWCEEGFVIKKVKNTVPWTYVISDLNGEEIVEKFYKKNYKKNQKVLRIEKIIMKKVINLMLDGKARIVLLAVGLTKKA